MVNPHGKPRHKKKAAEEHELASSRGLVQSAKLRARFAIHDSYIKGEYHPSTTYQARSGDPRPRLPAMYRRVQPYDNPAGLPITLQLPDLPDVQHATLTAIAPELKQFTVPQIRAALVHNGQRIFGMFQKIHVEAPRSTLPDFLDSPVTDLALLQCATHLLAIYKCADPLTPPSPAERNVVHPHARREVALFPTHHLHLAAHCARLPSFPTLETDVESVEFAHPAHYWTNMLRLPVVVLRLPDPTTFPVLERWIYTMNVDILGQDLIPVPWPDFRDDAEGNVRLIFIHGIAEHGEEFLARCLRVVNGVFSNAVTLGINEKRFWIPMGFACTAD